MPADTAPTTAPDPLGRVALVLLTIAILILAVAQSKPAWSPAPAPVPVPAPAPLPAPAPITPPAPVNPPAPLAIPPALAQAVLTYRDTLAPTFASVAAQVRAGAVADQATLGAAFRPHNGPLEAAIGAAVQRHGDANGVVTDPAGLADELDAVAQTLGSN